MTFIKPFEVPQEVLFNSQVLFQQIFKLRRSGCQGLREDNKSLFIMEKTLRLLFLQRALNITIPIYILVLLIKTIKN